MKLNIIKSVSFNLTVKLNLKLTYYYIRIWLFIFLRKIGHLLENLAQLFMQEIQNICSKGFNIDRKGIFSKLIGHS